MSKLQLNEPNDYKAFPEEGTDTVVSQMPKLMTEGRTPLSMAGVMKARLNFRNSSSEDVRNSWLHNYFFTGDGIVYHPEGRVKIDLDSERLRKVTLQTRLCYRALPLQTGEYDSLQAPELSREEAESLMNGEWLKPKQVLDNRAWRIFARHPDEVPADMAEDVNLLREYNGLVSSESGSDRTMAIFKASSYDVPTMRSAVLGWFVNRSNAFGGDVFGYDDARLVGVLAPYIGEKIKEDLTTLCEGDRSEGGRK